MLDTLANLTDTRDCAYRAKRHSPHAGLASALTDPRPLIAQGTRHLHQAMATARRAAA